MWVIGISKSHNGAVALIKDGKVIVANRNSFSMPCDCDWLSENV